MKASYLLSGQQTDQRRLAYRRRRIGLLGGSFNPAHDGHRHISLLALRRLRLDGVWWLVSPQNPLKSSRDMAPLAARLQQARQIARHPRIMVTDIEARLGTRYTADTLAAMRRGFPALRFVWLMGADNLEQLPRWQRWRQIFTTVPVAIFARPAYSGKAMSGQAARRFARFRLREAAAPDLAEYRPPAWVFLKSSRHPGSATRIRQRRTRATRSGHQGA